VAVDRESRLGWTRATLDGPGPWVEEGWPLLAIRWAGLSAGLGAALAASTAATSSAVIAVAGLLAPSSLRMA